MLVLELFDGSSSGASEAIFHDSIETSERTSVTTLKFVTRVFFRAAGPVISVVLFYALGDAWTRGELRTVFYVGVSLSAIPALLLLCFRDSSTLGAESDAVRLEDPDACFDITQSPYVALADDAGDLEVEEDPLVLEQLGNSSFEVAKYRIPRIVLMSDVFFGLASGMTIKFFPLFFKEEVQMSPASVNWIYVVSPMCVVSLSILANRLTATFGRVRVPLVFSSSGICLLLLMWYMGHELWQNKAAIVPIFIARTALMNCCSPIRKSILIDFVNKEARARWSSMDSVTQFSWSGSAVLGGLLVDKYGYGSSFLATALVQIAALSTFGSLLYYRQIIDGVHRTGVN
uniref:Major facilitator superfamily (MFS) profile domain-containing protein n=1 Tax=Mucochytrium quahogii TaxID=96639 RepID=A0A7S2S739_9STRA